MFLFLSNRNPRRKPADKITFADQLRQAIARSSEQRHNRQVIKKYSNQWTLLVFIFRPCHAIQQHGLILDLIITHLLLFFHYRIQLSTNTNLVLFFCFYCSFRDCLQKIDWRPFTPKRPSKLRLFVAFFLKLKIFYATLFLLSQSLIIYDTPLLIKLLYTTYFVLIFLQLFCFKT